MIPFFPQLLPDEHLFSGIARYHQISGNCTVNHTWTQIGIFRGPLKPQDVSNQPYHSALKAAGFILQEPLVKIARLHTLSPLLKLTMPLIVQEQQNEEWGHSKSSLPSSENVMNDRMLTFDKSWRFCHMCVKADERRVGVCYWHLSHQIPTIVQCHIHQVPLISSGLKTLNELQLPGDLDQSVASENSVPPVTDWECWFLDLVRDCREPGKGRGVEDLVEAFENAWNVPKRPRQAKQEKYQEILHYIEEVAGTPFLATIFEFYQGNSTGYRGRKRPNFIQTTFGSSDPAIFNPVVQIAALKQPVY